jgi:hypothetical protein
VTDSGDAFEPDLDLWEPWTPAELAERLAGVSARWYVLAGWALDMFLGRQTRVHEDLEIGVPRDAFPEIRDALADCELFVVGDGKAWPLSEPALAAHRQTWARERATGLWRVDVIREVWDGDVWICQRDERIRVPADELILRTRAGNPYVRPDVALLFKAKAARPKDETDFATVLPALDETQRSWLAGSLELAHPGHPWLRALAGTS